MAQASVPDMFSGVSRIKWWRYRYLLIALLLSNAFIIHYFFLDRSATSLNPFQSSPITQDEIHPPPTQTDKFETHQEQDTSTAEPAEPEKSVIMADPPEEEHKPAPAETEIEKPAEGEQKEEEKHEPETVTPGDTESKKPAEGENKAEEKPKESTDDEHKAEEKPKESTGDEHKAEEKKPENPAEPLTDAEKLKAQDPPPQPTKPPIVIPSYAPVKYVPPPNSRSTFTLNDYDFNGEYVGWPLERVCKESTWTPGLHYVCDNNSGGIGNIRNFILTCIRYAIDAGASGVIMPRIQKRSEENLGSLFTSSFQPFDYFFDEKHFRTVLGKYCPQITLYDSVDSVPYAENLLQAKDFTPKDLDGSDGCDRRGINRHLDQYRVKHDQWIQKYYRFPNETHPVSVRNKWATFFEWPIYRDGPEFALTFGDILRFRTDIEELAATTLQELSNLIHNKKNGTRRGKKLNAPFLGVHLRTEKDALEFWPDYETQVKGYLHQAGTRGFKYAYIASGDAEEGHRFGELSMKHLGMKVVGKTDLLHGEALDKLNKFSWDQQALVDFLVLSKSSHFTGCSFSSFSMNLAARRHTMVEGITTRQWKNPGDVFSTLVGRFDSWFGDWLFMMECLWP